MAALLWLVVGVVLMLAEVVSGNFVLLMLGVAGLAASGSALLGFGLPASGAVFAVGSVVLMMLVRPALKRHMLSNIPHHRTNVEGLIGMPATVMSRVDAHGGQVKIGGDLWSARAFDEDEVFEPGHSVTVMDISGATAIVWAGPRSHGSP
jgi:membrane protein implicated in regulation of membrane protease activity